MRITNIVFLVLFMLMLIVPLVFVDLSNDRVSVEENRRLARPPLLANMKNHPGLFIRQFDRWFKDSTGFRERLIAIYNVIDKNKWISYTVLYREGNINLLRGEQGHHYCSGNNNFLIPKFMGMQFLSDKQLQSMAIKLEEAKRYLDKKGIPLVVMLCTDKETIYPEFYPKSIKRGSEPIQLEMITTYLQEHTSVDVFNIRQALLAEKKNFLLYPRSFGDLTHYNEVGAFFAYRELMKHINIHFPLIVPFEIDDLEIDYEKRDEPIISFITELTYKKLDVSFFDNVNLIRPFLALQNYACENTEPDLPVALFLHDSYANEYFIGKYFGQHFGRAIFIRHGNIKNLEEYINLYTPDIVVFESAERSLRGFANAVAQIPDLP